MPQKKTVHPLLSEETISAAIDLAKILKRIHIRLITEGYVIKDGVVTPPAHKREIVTKRGRPKKWFFLK